MVWYVGCWVAWVGFDADALSSYGCCLDYVCCCLCCLIWVALCDSCLVGCGYFSGFR